MQHSLVNEEVCKKSDSLKYATPTPCSPIHTTSIYAPISLPSHPPHPIHIYIPFSTHPNITPPHYHNRHHLFSTSKRCIAAYAMTMNPAEKTPSPMTSLHSARLSNPNADKIDAPGTSMSRPYLWSMRVR